MIKNLLSQIEQSHAKTALLIGQLHQSLSPLFTLDGSAPAKTEPVIHPHRKRKYRFLPKDLKKKVLDLTRAGKTIEEIAAQLTISSTSVSRIRAASNKPDKSE